MVLLGDQLVGYLPAVYLIVTLRLEAPRPPALGYWTLEIKRRLLIRPEWDTRPSIHLMDHKRASRSAEKPEIRRAKQSSWQATSMRLELLVHGY